MQNPDRFGVFLRPDPQTCAAVTAITGQLRAQYGLVSAAAFPPHVTLAGSLPLRRHPEALIGALSIALADRSSFWVENAGVARLQAAAIIFDVHNLGDRPNAAMVDLAAAIDRAIRPLIGSAQGLPADMFVPERWHGHISLASHDLVDRPDLRDEVEAYIAALRVEHPARFAGDTVTVYRFTHASWTGPWWRSMSWEHVRSLRLAGA